MMLLQVVLLCFFAWTLSDAKKASKEVIHRLAITGLKDLELHEEDNPCKTIRQYCRGLVGQVVSYDQCFQQLHMHTSQQVSKLWDVLAPRLNVDESFFVDCEPLSVSKSDFEESPVPGTARNSSGIVHEMLDLLDRARNRDTAALAAFNSKRYEYELTDWERWKLYKKALLMLPSNLFVVDQFGLCLLYAGYDVKARRFFKNAVDRGLWGNPMQRPVSKYVSGLTAKPWHDKKDYPFIKVLEAGSADIRSEFEYNLKEQPHIFTGEMENLHVGGEWFELRLKSSGTGFTDYTSYFPKTMKVINNTRHEFTSIKFSAIRPGTHIRVHTGPTNERLRVHLSLVHSGGARIRVGSEWRSWEEGQAFIFDDSFEHEVLHEGEDLRAVLIMDIWHPELPEEQRIIH